jgi:hypothetical protein
VALPHLATALPGGHACVCELSPYEACVIELRQVLRFAAVGSSSTGKVVVIASKANRAPSQGPSVGPTAPGRLDAHDEITDVVQSLTEQP